MDTEDTTVLTTVDVDGTARDRLRMRLLPQDQTLMLTLMLMAGDIEDTTVPITMDTGMARDRLRMRLLPQDQTLMLMLMLMAGVIMVDTTVPITMDTGMVRDRLRTNLLPQGQTLTLMLMAGDTGEDTTVHTMEVTTGENKTPTNTNISSKYFSSNNTVVHRWSW